MQAETAMVSEGEREDTRRSGREAYLQECLLAVGMLDHQLKTDAAIVHGWAVLLDESWTDIPEDQRREAIRVIRRRAQMLADVAKTQLEEAAAGWTDDSPAALGEVDLAAALRALTAEMAAAAVTHSFRYEGPQEMRRRVDAAAIERVCLQLLENAVRYSPSGSEVVVALKPSASTTTIEIVDEGSGVPDGVDLFAPFARHSDVAGGSGLGLFVVRRAVESMGGTVRAWRNPSWGSTFEIVIPVR